MTKNLKSNPNNLIVNPANLESLAFIDQIITSFYSLKRSVMKSEKLFTSRDFINIMLEEMVGSDYETFKTAFDEAKTLLEKINEGQLNDSSENS